MTIKDIARIAKVSKSAVSLALSGKAGVSEATRKRIIKIANEYGYTAKNAAMHKKNNQKLTIRFLICTNDNFTLENVYSSSFFSQLISGIESRSKQLSYNLVFESCEKSMLEKSFYNDDSKGTILLATYCHDNDLNFITRFSNSTVILDNYSELLPVNCVNMNSLQGAYSAAEHLINLGHRHIGIVKSKVSIWNFSQRSAGFFKCLQDNGIACNSEDIFTASIDINSARNDFLSDITHRTKKLPTAFFCECDFIALGVIKALQQMGYSVPDDVSVIGFDDVSESSILVPDLTTVRVEKYFMGALAVNRLHEMITVEDNMIIKSLIDTKLQIRSSCKAMK